MPYLVFSWTIFFPCAFSLLVCLHWTLQALAAAGDWIAFGLLLPGATLLVMLLVAWLFGLVQETSLEWHWWKLKHEQDQ